jgi:signal transduction histidine kinase/AraC-like DNA-binding protein
MNPTGGDKIIKLALDILNHNDFPTEITLPTNVINKRNAKVLKLQSDYIDQQKVKIISLNDKIDSYFVRYTNQRAMLYSSFILLLLFFILLFLALKSNKSIKYLNSKLSKQNHKTNSQKEKLEKQRDQLLNLSKQLKEATHSKLMFFTNISHDFLTPLTLVIEPIKQLILDLDLSRKQLKLLQLIEKNINILVHLVTQILDFRKYEEGKMELILSKNDLKVCLEEWNKIFLPSFINNKIKFSFNINDNFQDYSVVFDQEKIQRIYFNLLSNALKFTNENGKVHVELSSKLELGRKYAIIKISDNGIGVSVEHIQNIFNKFYQVETNYAGSGIGLALVKSFVDLHKGEIIVESNQGRGSTFTVKLPFEQQGHFKLVSNLESNPELFFNYNQEDSYMPMGISLEKPKELVLVIDDNPNIHEYLSLLLQKEYNLLKARDGKDGINMAMKYIPDIILCDVMMPVMDGLECCHWLKSEVLTCHIPIMMLTVSSQDEQRIEGFKSGADAYIAKPFNSEVLQTQIRTLIQGRKQLMQFFSDKSSVFGNTAGDLDKGFIEKIMCLIGKNLSDSNLNVEDLGKIIGLSRVQLYRKVKSITNNSPNEIIRMCRLKKARSLLAASELSISEIAYEVGFSSPSYFNKCYKKYFNENPTVLLKRVKEGS